MIQGVRYITTSYETFKVAGQASGTGFFAKDLGTPSLGTVWLIDRIYYHIAAATPSDVVLRVRAVADLNLIDYVSVIEADHGNTENVADETNPLIVRNNEHLRPSLVGADANGQVFLRIDYRIAVAQRFAVPDSIELTAEQAAALATSGDDGLTSVAHTRRPAF